MSPLELKLKLAGMGLDVDESHFYTSALATAKFVSQQTPNCKAYVIGDPGLVGALYQEGVAITDKSPDYVIIGESAQYNYDTICKAVTLVQNGARLIGTNTDLTGPGKHGIMGAKDPEIAKAIVSAVKACDSHLILVALSGSEMIKAAKAAGLTVASEVFADRAYNDDGSLVSRSLPGAVITDAKQVAERAVIMTSIKAASGEVFKALCYSIDVTNQKKAEERYEQELTNLRQAGQTDDSRLTYKGHHNLTQNKVIDYDNLQNAAVPLPPGCSYDEACQCFSMEISVGFQYLLAVFSGSIEFHQVTLIVKLLYISRGYPFYCPLHRKHLQSFSYSIDIFNILSCKALGEASAVWYVIDKSFVLKLFERLAYWRAADSQLLCNLIFLDFFSNVIFTLQNAFPDNISYLIRQ